MKKLSLLFLVFVSCWAAAQRTSEDAPAAMHSKRLSSEGLLQKCLPKDIKLDDVASNTGAKKITVEQKLKELGASCNAKGKLVSAKRKPIAFYRMQGCWGNPPAGYRQIMAEQDRKIKELEKTNDVIRMTCNPQGREIN